MEAIQNYLRVLKPNGILNIYRWNFSVPRESLRLCNLFLEAAVEAHNPHPDQCIMIVGAGADREMRWAAMLMKNGPFTQNEVDRVLAQINRQPDLALVYLPKIYSPEKQKEIEREQLSAAAICAAVKRFPDSADAIKATGSIITIAYNMATSFSC